MRGHTPPTGREIRLRKTCKTERAAQIEFGKLFERAAVGCQPDSDGPVKETNRTAPAVSRSEKSCSACRVITAAICVAEEENT